MKPCRRPFHGLLYLACCLLCGCSTGAMRIDVDVYKGPLAQTSDTQFASLIGYLEEAKRSIVENMNFTLAIVANHELVKDHCDGAPCRKENLKAVEVGDYLKDPNDKLPKLHLYFPVDASSSSKALTIDDAITWCDQIDPDGVFSQISYFDCTILRAVFSDSRDMLREVNDALGNYVGPIDRSHFQTQDEDETRNALMEVAEMASEFRAKAFRWGVAGAAGQSSDCKTRIALVNFIMIASEYGNQLQSRVDSLSKQLGLESGRDAKELALSTHLQETRPTDFVHLYDWLEASIDACPGDWVRRYLWPGYPNIDVETRIKVVQRLYADHYWSRINSVHASGAGDTNYVFVKDGIGNWNLKSFQSDPGALLTAYLDVGKKLLATAADVAATSSGVGSGGVVLSTALKYANQFIAGGSTASPSTHVLEDLQSLEASLRSALTKQASAAAQKDVSLKSNPAELRTHRLETIAQFQATLGTFANKVNVLNKTLQNGHDTKGAEDTVKKILSQ